MSQSNVLKLLHLANKISVDGIKNSTYKTKLHFGRFEIECIFCHKKLKVYHCQKNKKFCSKTCQVKHRHLSESKRLKFVYKKLK